jgi:carbamoyltransferase
MGRRAPGAPPHRAAFMTAILGISAYYHDSAACLVVDGEIVAAAQEERFSRKKHDSRFPTHAIAYCLSEADLGPDQLDVVGFYDKPLVKFDRLLETYVDYAPAGFPSFLKAMPLWMKEKLWLPDLIRREFAKLEGLDDPKAVKRRAKTLPWRLCFGDHHESHAASAFYPSPYEQAAIITVDGVGEWATCSVGHGNGAEMTLLHELRFPDSLGLLYSAFTYFAGFKVNSGEYKIMGLAPYGEPTYVDLIKDKLLDIKDDGSVRLHQEYFTYSQGLRMTGKAFERLLGGPAREPESRITQREMDLARSIQDVTEEIMLKMAGFAHRETGLPYLCLAGGVALNCVANGRILREGPFEDIWVQPAAGDAGGALGVALAIWHRYLGQPRRSAETAGTWVPPSRWPAPVTPGPPSESANRSVGAMGRAAAIPPYADAMHGAYLGPRDSSESIRRQLDAHRRPYRQVERTALADAIAESLAAGKVVGLHQGRMEFGPRALGGRSIIGDPRSPQMQSVMNLKIKYRESFRPFAPSVLREDVAEWFQLDADSPYMLLVAGIAPARRRAMSVADEHLWGIDKLNIPRSEIPAVTHVDYSARVQTVRRDVAPLYWEIIAAFRERTGCPVIVNTSFNVRGEPIVCTPEDSYRCFMRTEMEVLALEDCLLEKSQQPAFDNDADWQSEFALD